MITVKQAAFSYDGRNELFSDLSFSLAAGEILTILGRNGIGKTTFLRCLLAFCRGRTGSVWWAANAPILLSSVM